MLIKAAKERQIEAATPAAARYLHLLRISTSGIASEPHFGTPLYENFYLVSGEQRAEELKLVC